MNLTTALDIFTDHLIDIKESLATNIIEDMSKLEPRENPNWVEKEVDRLKAEAVTAPRMKIIKRIVSRLQVRENPHKSFNSINDDDIARAREFPIEEMFEGQLYNGGSGRKVGRCPWHNSGNERTPSFYVFQDNRYKCFGCQISGDAISFYMELHGVEFIKAVKALMRS